MLNQELLSASGMSPLMSVFVLVLSSFTLMHEWWNGEVREKSKAKGMFTALEEHETSIPETSITFHQGGRKAGR